MARNLGLILAVLAGPALADEAATVPSGMAGGISVSSSYSVNAPVTGAGQAAMDAEEREYRRAMYSRATTECEDLLATIAANCALTSISVSSQVNAYPGQPPTLYVSVSVTAQVELKTR
jgi:hypothetical protein